MRRLVATVMIVNRMLKRAVGQLILVVPVGELGVAVAGHGAPVIAGDVGDEFGLAIGKAAQFGVADETAWKVGLACGGKVEIFVHSLAGQDDLLGALRELAFTRKEQILRPVDFRNLGAEVVGLGDALVVVPILIVVGAALAAPTLSWHCRRTDLRE